MSKSSGAVKRYHDRVARRYDAIYDDDYWAWHDGLTWDHLKAFLPTDQRAEVADLGCGTGKWGLRLLHAGYRVTFLDISGSMVEQARRKVEAAGREDRAEFVVADLADLSALDRGRFALATAFGDPIGCTDRPGKAVKQIARVLQPGGTLVATFDNRLAGIEHYLEKGRIEELETFLKTGRTTWLTQDAAEQFPIATYTPAQVRKLMTGAGLEVVDMIGKSVLPVRSYRKMLADGAMRRRLGKIEKRLWRDEAAIGRCAHIQVAARRVD